MCGRHSSLEPCFLTFLAQCYFSLRYVARQETVSIIIHHDVFPTKWEILFFRLKLTLGPPACTPFFLHPLSGRKLNGKSVAATFRLARYAYTFHCIFDKIKGREIERKYFSKPDKDASFFRFDLVRNLHPRIEQNSSRKSYVEKCVVPCCHSCQDTAK